MKLRTVNQLQDKLDEEIAWRIKELADLKFSVQSANSLTKKTLIRAGVALLYAHWEGFIKSSSRHYLIFIFNQGCCYRDLKSCLIVISLKSKIEMLSQSRQAEKNIETVNFLMSELDRPARLPSASSMSTEFNLRAHVFENIARSLDIPVKQYAAKHNLIDVELVDRRNAIAHGEYLDISAQDWRKLADEIIGIMKGYKIDIQNCASQKLYKRE